MKKKPEIFLKKMVGVRMSSRLYLTAGPFKPSKISQIHVSTISYKTHIRYLTTFSGSQASRSPYGK